MDIRQLVDELYEAFAAGLDDELPGRARDLPYALRLAAHPGARWSDVFALEVTLGAPALFAQAMPYASEFQIREAVLAHLLAVIGAFGVDRIEDDQVEPSAHLLAVLAEARSVRDRTMARLCGGRTPADLEFATADLLILRAIRRERSLLLSARSADVQAYERASLEKQCVGWLATEALGRAAGCSPAARRAIKATLQSVALALQAYDDVVDWEEDLERGGSWAVCLMKTLRPETSTNECGPESSRVRAQVLRSGVLVALLERALWRLRRVRRRATALGLTRLAAWAASRATRFEALVAAERASAGYAVRAHALAAWVDEVLA
jgi:hypothetical protein